jgi:hypothetical protein
MGGDRHESLCSANPMNTIPPSKRSNEEKQHITEAKRTKNPTMNYSKHPPKSASTPDEDVSRRYHCHLVQSIL